MAEGRAEEPKRAGPRRAAQIAKTRGITWLGCVACATAPDPDHSQKFSDGSLVDCANMLTLMLTPRGGARRVRSSTAG